MQLYQAFSIRPEAFSPSIAVLATRKQQRTTTSAPVSLAATACTRSVELMRGTAEYIALAEQCHVLEQLAQVR